MKLTNEQFSEAAKAVSEVIKQKIADGTLYESDMFKYTPAYRGDAWRDLTSDDSALDIKESID